MALHEQMTILKALGDENRVRLLLALREGELCVCQLVELLGLATSTVSQHLGQLRQARLVLTEKRGRWIYYRRPEWGLNPLVDRTLYWLDACCGDSEIAAADRERVQGICRLEPTVLTQNRGRA